MPIVERNGSYETELFGVRRSARDDDDLVQLERDIADVGFYSFVTTADEAERLSDDEAQRDVLLHRLMNERVAAWLALATERLAESGTPLYLIAGNDDDFAIDPILDDPQYATGQRRRQGARPARAGCSSSRAAGRTTRRGRPRARRPRTSSTRGSTRWRSRCATRVEPSS